MVVSQEWQGWLMWNQKEVNRLVAEPTMSNWPLNRRMAVTSDFYGEILKWPYLRNGKADWHWTRGMLVGHSWAPCQIRKIAGAHAQGMSGTFSPSPRVSDPDTHHGTSVTHVPWCMPGSPTSSLLWSRWQGKTFPAFPAHAQPTILRIWQEAHGDDSDLLITATSNFWARLGWIGPRMD